MIYNQLITFNQMAEKKTTKGKYVSKSTYQKLVEENKKLLRDIRILTGQFTLERMVLAKIWKDKFEKEKQFKEEIKTFITEMNKSCAK